MIAPPDPTNANAVAGPSRLPASGAAAAGAPVPPASGAAAPPPPSTSTAAPGAEAGGQGEAAARARPAARRADGPLIVKTVVAADGVREVPSAFEHCEVEDLITLISSMLDRLIEHNDRIPLTPNSLTRFHSRAPPNISVKDYLIRIARYTNVEPCCLLILLPYVDKVCARLNTFTVSSLTVHRFIIAAVSVGSKALSDAFCTNGRYARVGGVSIVEMNLLEKEFCEALDWRLTTSGPVLAHYYSSLVRSHPRYRLSDAPLPVPPTPPPIDVPPFFSPSPQDARLAPVSPSVAFAGTGLAMDVDTDSSSAPAAAPAPPVTSDAPVPMSTDPAPVDRPSPSSPPSPPPQTTSAQPNSGAYSSSVSPSSNSSFSRSASTSAFASLAPSPERSPERNLPRGRPPPSASTSSPFPPGPPLIPPSFSRLSSTSTSSGLASHLPSPARPSHAPPPPGADGVGPVLAGANAALSPRFARTLNGATGPPPPSAGTASPAKRGRGRSNSSSGGGGGGGAGSPPLRGAGGDADPRARFQPSPRLSVVGGGATAPESAMAAATAGGGGGYFGTSGGGGGGV
ncbi:hypothetical protein JCM6882_008487 [Rhodosporidiobolus microsporus]